MLLISWVASLVGGFLLTTAARFVVQAGFGILFAFVGYARGRVPVRGVGYAVGIQLLPLFLGSFVGLGL